MPPVRYWIIVESPLRRAQTNVWPPKRCWPLFGFRLCQVTKEKDVPTVSRLAHVAQSRLILWGLVTWMAPSVWQQDAFAGGSTCPDAADLYEQCLNFAPNGAEGEFYARSDLVLDLSAADNFTLQAQGTISRIRWWGTYLISEAGCALFPDNFTVRFWRNANGNPIGPDALPIPAYTVTRSADSVGEIPAALGAPAPVFEYELTFAHDGFQAEADETYWLEIQNDYTVSGGCYWVWLAAPAAPGDGSSRQRSPSTDPDWSAPAAWGFDLAFSLLLNAGGRDHRS